MTELIGNSLFFGAAVSLLAYWGGMLLRRKLHSAAVNPLLIAVALVIALLALTGISYEDYYAGAKYISYLLTPATVALAVPLYRQFALLRHNAKAIAAGILSGVASSIGCIFGMALLFGFTHEEYVTFLPKSITTAIGMGVSEELGGYAAITAAVIIVTGILGNILGDLVFRLFRIEEPVERGIALGSASHAIGTAKAMELGETEGAMSSLSIVISGVITVAAAMLAAGWV